MIDKLLINATILSNPNTIGLGVYTCNLLSRLLPMLCKDVGSVVLIGDRGRLKRLFPEECDSASVRICHLDTTNPFMRLVALNRVVRGERGEGTTVFYSPTHHGVVVRGIRQVMTIHDLFPLLFPTNYRQQYYYFKYYLPRTLHRTDTVITVSRVTANDVARLCAKAPRTVTVYEGLRDDFLRVTPSEISEVAGRKFFLFVGPNFPHKNAERLIDAFVKFSQEAPDDEHFLVFSGGREPYLGTLRSHIEEIEEPKRRRILFLGHVSGEELAWLYSAATATMVTSLYEGFGLPALEAMHFECPVVASNRGSLPEVCGSAALFVNPEEVNEISLAMHRISSDHTLRNDLQKQGRENLKRFSWDMAARKVCEVLLRQ